MMCDPKTAQKSEYQGKTYYFCSVGCKRSFDKEPQRYVVMTHEPAGHH